jgi:hypothetical protein
MPKPAHIIMAAAVFAIALCDAAELIRDGSTKEKAIRLKQHGMKAVDEEMQWMMKLYHYTPVLATRDALANAVRQIKAGKKKNVQNLHPWEHGSLDDHGKLISYWSFDSPRGKQEIYFDTGTFINTSGEVARQESARAHYMRQKMQSLKDTIEHLTSR